MHVIGSALLKPEGNAPVGAHRHRKRAAPVAHQAVKMKTRQVQFFGRFGGLKGRKNLPYLPGVVGIQAATVALLIEAPQPTMPKTCDHASPQMRIVRLYALQVKPFLYYMGHKKP